MQGIGFTLINAFQRMSTFGTAQEYYAQKMSEVFQSTHLYPNAGLLAHGAAWYNLTSVPGFAIQPSEAVKWQVLFAAKAYMDPSELIYEAFNLKPFGKCTVAEGFTLDYLTPNDIVLLYRILISFLDAQSAQGRFTSNASILTRYHVGLIGDHVSKNCKNKDFADQISLSIHQQQHPDVLEGLLLRVSIQSDLFERLRIGDKKEAIFSYLDDFYRNLKEVPEWRKETEFYCFLKVLDQVCPELEVFTYFFDFGNGSVIANIPDMRGIRTLIDHFNTKEKDAFKYKGKLNDVEVVDLIHLPESLRLLETTNFQGEKRFEILNGGKAMGTVGGHYDPIFVRRVGSQTTIIIADSAPFESKDKEERITPSHWLPFLKGAIQQANFSHLKIYTFFPGRQSDNLSCPIMSLRDILESCKTDLFAFVDGLKPDQISEKNGFLVIKHFPPNFMKVKQSTSYIDQYEKDAADTKTKIVASKVIPISGMEFRVDKTLRMVVEAHTVHRDGSKVNFYLRERCYKYFGIIVRQMINQKLG